MPSYSRKATVEYVTKGTGRRTHNNDERSFQAYVHCVPFWRLHNVGIHYKKHFSNTLKWPYANSSFCQVDPPTADLPMGYSPIGASCIDIIAVQYFKEKGCVPQGNWRRQIHLFAFAKSLEWQTELISESSSPVICRVLESWRSCQSW
jgi:hypothetical protein